MIQRIQTLFLVAALAFLIPVFYSVYAALTQFVVLTAVACACVAAAICLFKHRKLQIRLGIYAAVILLGQQIWMGVVYFQQKEVIPFTISTVFPIVSGILVLLAVKYIARDEAMVQSYHRLRPTKGAKRK